MPRRMMIAVVAVAAALLFATGAVAALLIAGGDDDKGSAADERTGKGYLGLTVTANQPQGLRVASIEANGPAASGGIQAGDFVRSVDGQVMRTPEQLRTAVEAKKPGSQVTITYERGDKELQASVKLGDAPANAQIEATPAAGAQNQQPNRGNLPNAANRGQLGVQVQNITPQLKERYGLTRDSGVVITQVQPNTGAAAAGLRAGDVIISVNGRNVSQAQEVTTALATSASGQQVSLGIVRGSEQLTVPVTLSTAQAVPGFENLPAAIQERLRELAQGGTYSLEQLQRLAMGQNNLTMGTVKSISDSSIVVTRFEAGNDVTYTLTAKTEYRLGANDAARGEIKAGSNVMVISLDGQNAIGVFVFQR